MSVECNECGKAATVRPCGNPYCDACIIRLDREAEQHARDVEDTDRREREADLRESCGMPPGCDTYYPRY